jgi:DNA-binding response OmpR family regulator
MAIINFAVLVVDDEEMVRHFMKRALEEDGYQVLVARDGNEALAIIETFAIQVVITDIRMPGMDGKALGTEIARRPNPPEVVYASASDTPPEGVDHRHYLQKPFTGADLRAKVKAILGQ